MRNLKRALSLTLASVMLLGMMIVGTSAASYPDVDENDNVEAIEVLNAVGVMVGDNGNFKPDAPVTRNEMAVIMAKLLLGTYAADSYVGTHPFTDVPAWANRYVAACYASGIVAGTSATTYDGSSNVTAVQAAAMMLRALGYEDLSKNAARWDQPVAAKANEIALFTGMNGNGNAKLNRNDVAKLALNTLKSTMVTTRRTTSDIQIGDVNIVAYIEYNERGTTTLDYTQSNGKYVGGTSTDDKLQLCEYLYGTDLVLAGSDNDDFGRPATKWTYKGAEVKSVNTTPVLTLTTNVKEKDVFSKLGVAGISGKFDKYVVMDEIWENGAKKAICEEINTSGTSTAGGGQWQADSSSGAMYKENVIITKNADTRIGHSDNGYRIDLYATDTAYHYIMVVTKYTLSEVTSVTTNKDGDVTYAISGVGSRIDYADPDKKDTVSVEGSVAKGDVVTYAVVNGVTYVYPTTKIVGAQSAINIGKNTITVSGTTYDLGAGVSGVTVSNTAFANSSKDANYYVDCNGYVVKTDAVGSTDYAAINAIAKVAGLSSTVQAELVFPDASKKIVTVSSLKGEDGSSVTLNTLDKDGDNNADTYQGVVCTYIIDSNGEYELTAVPTDAGNGITSKTVKTWSGAQNVTTKGSPTVHAQTDINANNDTIFVVRYTSGSKTEIKAYTGFKSVPTIASTATANEDVVIDYVKNSDGDVEFVYIDATATSSFTDSASSGDIVYITSLKYTETGDSASSKRYAYPAIINGEVGTLVTTTKKDSGGSNDLAKALYKVTATNNEGEATTLVLQGTLETGVDYKKYNTFTTYGDAGNGYIQLDGSNTYTFDDSETVYVIDKDGGVSTSVVSAIKAHTNADTTAEIYVKIKSGTTTNEIDTVYVIEK